MRMQAAYQEIIGEELGREDIEIHPEAMNEGS